ncbi:MAG: Gfo/Idh/MocA family oxidoreductase [Candidatus Omnitrophica bacterium]|nr:Gfo/Idh/MocA family oxidoreductase [Candidatus Omnitrophota bacterium]
MITLAHVGAGAWGQNHIRTFSSLKDCHLKICCDKRKEALDKISTVYGHRFELTSDFEDILKDKDVQAVVIASPAGFHVQMAMEALSAGKHVFVEKPLALNLREGKKVVDFARKNKKILMVGHLLLYHPAVLMLKEYIQKGELGDVFYLYSTRVNLGRIREEENALWSLTSHDISVTLFLLADVPIEVTTKGESYLRKGIEDVVFATLKFKNDVLAQIHASWLDPHKMRKFTIVGSKKMAVFDDMQASEKIRLYDKGVERKTDYHTYAEYLALRNGDINIPRVDMKEPLQVECQHFLDCINKGEQPVSDGHNSLKVLAVLEAAQASLDKGGLPVKIKDAGDE